jgi:hypothetical protein
MVLTFTNTGQIPLEETDFSVPLSLDFGDNAKIFSYSINNTIPKNLDVSAEIEGGKLSFSPILLNPSDSFTVQVIGTGLPNAPDRGGRIVGVTDIPIVSIYIELTNRANLLSSILAGVFLVIFILLPLMSLTIIIQRNRLRAKRNPTNIPAPQAQPPASP